MSKLTSNLHALRRHCYVLPDLVKSSVYLFTNAANNFNITNDKKDAEPLQEDLEILTKCSET